MTFESLKQMILEITGVSEEDFDPNEHLVDYGLDSIQLVDILAHLHDNGIEVEFSELAEEPTFSGWWKVIAARMGEAK